MKFEWKEEPVLLRAEMLSFPGGGFTKGDANLITAITREVFEEIGLTIDPDKLESMVSISRVDQTVTEEITLDDRKGEQEFRVDIFFYDLNSEELSQLEKNMKARSRQVEIMTLEEAMDKKDKLRPLAIQAIEVYQTWLKLKRGEINFDNLT